MLQDTSATTHYRVLLIGIDDYTRPEVKLRGCVSDIDLIEEVLLHKVQVPAGQIRRLASPQAAIPSRSSLPSAPATRDNVRAALKDLAATAKQGDRVFIYYTGHGVRTKVAHGQGTIFHEALVPVDFDAEPQMGRLLYEVELNGLLEAIAARTDDLTVVLDCCHSAGATRDIRLGPEVQARTLTLTGPVRPPDEALLSQTGAGRGGLSAMAQAAEAGQGPRYLVVAACQANETASEKELPAQSGRRHGVLTYCLSQVIGDGHVGDLAALRWADIMPGLLGMMSTLTSQTPWLIGRAERRVFGGPWQPEDSGYTVTASTDGRNAGQYRIGAGHLLGLTEGAEVAVYGAAPAFFAPVGSPEDLLTRCGVLKVVTAGPSDCIAQPLDPSSGASFVLPPLRGRGRLVRPGTEGRLRVQLLPHNEELSAFLDASGAMQVLRQGSDAVRPEIWVRTEGDKWLLEDEVHQQSGDGSMASVPVGRRSTLLVALWHYADYNRALRLARMARACRALPGLDFCLLDYNGQQPPSIGLSGAETDLPLVDRDPSGNYYELRDRDQFCVRVDNRTQSQMYATLVNCTASGRVEYLGDKDVGPSGIQIFWLNGVIGSPFQASLPQGRQVAIERMIVVATSRPGIDLHYLEVQASLKEVIDLSRREVGPRGPAGPAELWTAETVLLRIRA